VDAGKEPGKRLHRLRWVEVSHRLRPMRKVPSRIPTASAAGQGGFGHTATSGKPGDCGHRGSTPALLPRKSDGPRGTAQVGSTRRKTPTNLFATPFESPVHRAGETGRMDGNGREATTAVMRNSC